MEISGNDLPNRPEVLDADVARALRLYFDDELSLREIAVELGISPNDGRELVTTGMQHLDRALAGDDDGGELTTPLRCPRQSEGRPAPRVQRCLAPRGDDCSSGSGCSWTSTPVRATLSRQRASTM
jgi:hypothetical protein